MTMECPEEQIDPSIVEHIQIQLALIQLKYSEAVHKLQEDNVKESSKLLTHMLNCCREMTSYATSIPNEKLVQMAVLLEQAAKIFSQFLMYDSAKCCYELGRIYLRALSTEDDFVSNAELYLSITKNFVQLLLFGHNSVSAINALRADAELFENSSLKEKCSTELAELLYELGYYLNQQSLHVNAAGELEKALKMLKESETRLVAKVETALGICYTRVKQTEAILVLRSSLVQWKKFPLQPEDIKHIVDTIYHMIELHMQNLAPGMPEKEVHELHNYLYETHKNLTDFNLGSPVPETLAHLGILSFQSKKQTLACSYFEKALSLFKESCNNTDPVFMSKLLRYIGITNYNQHKFEKAAPAYHECLKILLQSETTCQNCEQPLSKNSIADCYAALGFTYSRLRNFDSMLEYYEKALQLRNYLAQEDLELIDTNIGSLYHVKAAKYEKDGHREQAAKYHKLAEEAFIRALGYSWKSFPYINYGYYLLCRERYDDAVSNLNWGYSNGVVDKDTVEFDHTEDVILIKDLKFELCYREDIRMPSKIIALYLKAIAEMKAHRTELADLTVSKLQKEINNCKYEHYYTEGFGLETMKALCYSLVGYAYKALGKLAQAKEVFQMALSVVPEYTAAKQNVKLLTEQGVL